MLALSRAMPAAGRCPEHAGRSSAIGNVNSNSRACFLERRCGESRPDAPRGVAGCCSGARSSANRTGVPVASTFQEYSVCAELRGFSLQPLDDSVHLSLLCKGKRSLTRGIEDRDLLVLLGRMQIDLDLAR